MNKTAEAVMMPLIQLKEQHNRLALGTNRIKTVDIDLTDAKIVITTLNDELGLTKEKRFDTIEEAIEWVSKEIVYWTEGFGIVMRLTKAMNDLKSITGDEEAVALEPLNLQIRDVINKTPKHLRLLEEHGYNLNHPHSTQFIVE